MKKYSKETVVGFFVVVGLLCIIYMTVKLGKLDLFSENRYTLYADFTKVTGLRVGNPVDIMGLEVGRVASLSMDQKKGAAVVGMTIDKGVKIYDDAIASIKTEGLIGDRYVEIDPGGAGELLKPGGRILETEPPVDIQELIGKYAFGDVEKK